MSSAIFPASLPGQKWSVGKKPQFSTLIQRAASGKESRASMWAYPLWTFSLSYEVLPAGSVGTDFNTLLGFFLNRRGAFDSFLFQDPDDHLVENQTFGLGDGVTQSYQLVRSFGGFVEPVAAVKEVTEVRADGVLLSALTDYTVDSAGMVTLSAPLAGGKILSWSGSFYYRCRFLQDEAEFEQFLKDLWELRKLQFVGSPTGKIS